jgi:hypothetical protein
MLVVACAEGASLGGFVDERDSAAVPTPNDIDSGQDTGLPELDAGWQPMIPSGMVDGGDASMGNPPAVDAGPSAPPDAGMDAGTSKPPDAGPSNPPDAGRPVDATADTSMPPPPPDAGPLGQTCATTPSYATKDACSKCICAKCSSQINACYASSDATKNGQCRSVQECAETNHCTGEPCYCGTSLTCLLADGPCREVIANAAGTTDLFEIQTASTDLENPVGRANQTGTCTMTNCAVECGL